MATKKEIIDFYDFWAWQYKKRNPEIVTAANKVKNNADFLYASGLLRERAAIVRTQNIQILDLSRYQPFSFEFLRDPTDNEPQILAEIDQHFHLLADLDYNIYVVFEDTPTSTDIVHAVSSPLTVYRLTPVSQFKEESSAAMGLGKVADCCKESPMLPYNERFSHYDCFYIDINADDDVIKAAVLKEVHKLRYLERVSTYDTNDYPADDLNNDSHATKHNEYLEAEIHAAYRGGPGSSFRTNSFFARAVGLWLWERSQGFAQAGDQRSPETTFEALENELGHLIYSVKKEFPDNRILQHYLDKTAECIEAGAVLPFSTPREAKLS